MGPVSEKPGTIVIETNRFDVVLGRGKNANNRPGNLSFRRLVLNLVEQYQECASGEEKNEIARQIISEVQSHGGRFVRSVTAANANGQQIGAWEVVGNEVALAKVKQAMRDILGAAKKKAQKQSKREGEKRKSTIEAQSDFTNCGGIAASAGGSSNNGITIAKLPSHALNGCPSTSWQFNNPSAAVGMQQQLEMAHQRNRLVEMMRFQQQNLFQSELNSPSRIMERPLLQQSMGMMHHPGGLPVAANASQQLNLLPMMWQQFQQQEQFQQGQYQWGSMNSSNQHHPSLGPFQYHGLAASLHMQPHLQHTAQPALVGDQRVPSQMYQDEGRRNVQSKGAESAFGHAADPSTNGEGAKSVLHSAAQPPQLDSTGTNTLQGLVQSNASSSFPIPPLLPPSLGPGTGMQRTILPADPGQHRYAIGTVGSGGNGENAANFLPTPHPGIEDFFGGKPEPDITPLPDRTGKTCTAGGQDSLLSHVGGEDATSTSSSGNSTRTTSSACP